MGHGGRSGLGLTFLRGKGGGRTQDGPQQKSPQEQGQGPGRARAHRDARRPGAGMEIHGDHLRPFMGYQLIPACTRHEMPES